MKHTYVKNWVLGFAVLALVGCGSSSSSSNTGNTTPPTNTELSQDLKDLITYMYSEESLAHDVYLNIYQLQGVNTLYNIATNAEVQHIQAVNDLAVAYDLNMTQYPDTDVPYSINGITPGVYPVERIQELYNMLYDKGIQSSKDALEVGCIVEVVDITDLDHAIDLAERDNAADVLDVFNFLRDGSYNHYWAFNNALEQMGIETGCCSLGDEYCHPEYPQNQGNNGKKR